MRRTTRRLHGIAAVAALGMALVAGCQPEGITGARGDELPAPAEKVPLEELARRLGMEVWHAGSSMAALRNGANTVVLYCEPEGEVYVNGEAMPDSGGVVPHPDSEVGAFALNGGPGEPGTLLVPARLVSSIRSVLRPPQARSAPETAVVISASRRPRPRRAAGRVVIDPGHGGRDPGAISVLGSHEKHIVLAVSRLVAKELREAGAEVLMTRSDDTYVELEDRPAVADRHKADLFVSIHADAAPNRSAQGFTVYVSRSADGASVSAAGAIARRMHAAGIASRGVRRADYRVLAHSARPAVLVEIGYLSNLREARRLGSQAHRRSIAEAIARGVLDFLERP